MHLIQAVSRQPEFEAAWGGASPQLAELSQDLARQLIETRLTGGQEYLDRVDRGPLGGNNGINRSRRADNLLLQGTWRRPDSNQHS